MCASRHRLAEEDRYRTYRRHQGGGKAGQGKMTIEESVPGHKVGMKLDPEVDTAYPKRWIGKVELETTDGRKVFQRVDTPKGDPENTLSRPELEDKAIRLAQYAQGASEAEMRAVIDRIWRLRDAANVRDFLARG